MIEIRNTRALHSNTRADNPDTHALTGKSLGDSVRAAGGLADLLLTNQWPSGVCTAVPDPALPAEAEVCTHALRAPPARTRRAGE